MSKLCDTCIYRNNVEQLKPCIIYRDDCELYEKESDEMNDDLISRDELLKRIDEEREYLKSRGQFGAEHILVHNFRDLVENAPTVDAIVNMIEERPQAEWRSCKQGDIPITDRCTNCNYEMKWYKNKHNFCPNCGAKMRGKEK